MSQHESQHPAKFSQLALFLTIYLCIDFFFPLFFFPILYVEEHTQTFKVTRFVTSHIKIAPMILFGATSIESMYLYTCVSTESLYYGVATISRLLKIIGLFCRI